MSRITKNLLQNFMKQYDPIINLKTIRIIGPRLAEDWKRDPSAWRCVFKMQHTILFLKTTDKELDFINKLWGMLLEHLEQKKIEMTANDKTILMTDMSDYRREILKTFVQQYDSVINMQTGNFIAIRMLADWQCDSESWLDIFRNQHTRLGLNTNEEDLDFINLLWVILLEHLATKEKENSNDN